MRTRHSVALGVAGVGVLAILGVMVFAAGGIVARHQISPLVSVVDAAESNVKSLVKSLRGESDNEEYFTSAYYHLKRTTHETSETGFGDNVGFGQFGEGYLIGQRAGALKYVHFTEDNQVDVRQLETAIPTNKTEFLQATEGVNERLHVQFGVKDLFVVRNSDSADIYASHHFWHSDDQCWTMRVSRLETSADELLAEDAGALEWQTVYDTQPCLLLDSEPNHNNEVNTFLHSGGRLEQLDDGQLLLGVGDHFVDGQHNDNLVQDPSTSYGKVMLINPEDGTASMYSMGHRNPQGIYVDQQGTVWLAEQGPRGGDELNVIEQGQNYGWPMVSYGTDYAGVEWPEQFDWANHEGYTKPLWSWVPSIASNNLIRLENSAFPLWEGNLVVASLKDQGIHRVMIEDGRVMAIERIHIGNRVRDLTQTEDGDLLLLTDNGQMILIEAVIDGEGAEVPAELRASQLWAQCDSCHSRERNGGHSAGPNLHGVVGADIARFEDYNYTQALRQLDGTWTPERLHEFLRDPQQFAPGTAMAFPGMPDEQDRQILIDYLQQSR